MKKEELIRFFKLDKYDELFLKAIQPKSCGGDDEFKFLALKGDYILKACLLDILHRTYMTQNTGNLTALGSKFHNERTLATLSDYFGITSLMKPIDINYTIDKNDKKEVIEALLEASNQTNNLVVSKEIVEKLYLKAEELEILDFDVISKLQTFCQQNGFPIPEYSDPVQISGSDHNPIFQCEVVVKLEEEYTFLSEPSKSKDDARRSAALKASKKLNIVCENFTIITDEIEETLSAKKSLDSELLQFKQLGAFDAEMKLSKNTNQLLLDYIKEKYNDDPFEMLIKVSARLDDLSGNLWSASIVNNLENDIYELILLYLNLHGKDYFEIGIAESKNKAKKDAAIKIIERSKFFAWIEENYPKFTV